MLKRMDKLFMHFDAMYGLVWAKRFNSEEHLHFCKQQWAIALSDMTNQQLHKAIQLCLQGKELPPSLPEFKQLCRQYAPTYRAAVKPKCLDHRNVAMAEKYLNAIRIMLGMPQKENSLC